MIDKDKPVTPKLVFFKVDSIVTHAMVLNVLAAAADLKVNEVQPFILKSEDDAMERLIEKAGIHDDTGGAKLAFILNSVLSELFVTHMKLERPHARILIEMIAGMMANGNHSALPHEGLKREPTH